MFIPDGRQWHDFGQLYCGLPEGPDAVKKRWYPTCVTLPGYGQAGNDQLFIVSGTSIHQSNPNDPVNGTYEFRPQDDNGHPNNELKLFLEDQRPSGHATYPFVFVLPNGRMVIHSKNSTQFFTLSGNQVTTEGDPFFADDTDPHPVRQDPHGIPRSYPNSGTAVLLPLLPPNYNADVMLIGGGGTPPSPPLGAPRDPATATCLRLNTAERVWNPTTTPMGFGRVMPDAVLLPDATVLVVGGAERGQIANAEDPVYAAECYDPFGGSWRQWRPMSVPRGYHATALLLPDGRVICAGSADNNRNSAPDDWPSPSPGEHREFQVEVFTPPYLFDRASPDPVLAPRPVITAAPGTIGYSHDAGENVFSVDFQLPPHIFAGQGVSEVALLRCGSVTHGFNADQRYVGLAFTQTPRDEENRGILEVTPPPNAHVAPPGFYMLFIVAGTRTDYDSEEIDANGFKYPSEAKFVRLSQLPDF